MRQISYLYYIDGAFFTERKLVLVVHEGHDGEQNLEVCYFQ